MSLSYLITKDPFLSILPYLFPTLLPLSLLPLSLPFWSSHMLDKCSIAERPSPQQNGVEDLNIVDNLLSSNSI